MEYRIVSSNIRFDNPRDGDHQWKHRKSVLAGIINKFSPHLLGTQEGRRAQLYDFKGELKLELADDHREWIDERMYPCIFFDPNVVEVIESGDIWLSETPNTPATLSFDSAFPRLCTWISGRFKNSKQNFLYVNTHLDHSADRPRLGQIKVLMDEIDKLNKLDLPVILSGDFNESPTGAVRRELNHKWSDLIDPWLQESKAEVPSHHKFGERSANGQRIDWILFDKQFNAKSIELDKSSEDGIYPSDHFPVKSTFEFCP